MLTFFTISVIVIIVILIICIIGYKTGYLFTSNTGPKKGSIKEYRGNNGTVNGDTYCARDYENTPGVYKNMICTGVNVDGIGSKDCNYTAGIGTTQTVYCKYA